MHFPEKYQYSFTIQVLHYQILRTQGNSLKLSNTKNPIMKNYSLLLIPLYKIFGLAPHSQKEVLFSFNDKKGVIYFTLTFLDFKRVDSRSPDPYIWWIYTRFPEGKFIKYFWISTLFSWILILIPSCKPFKQVLNWTLSVRKVNTIIEV